MFGYWVVACDDADPVPRDGAAHGCDEGVDGLGLVREGETDGVLWKDWWLFGDVANESTALGVSFGADGWISICNDREWNVVKDVMTKGEIVRTGLDKAASGGHCDKA